jgi:hypothetical protein
MTNQKSTKSGQKKRNWYIGYKVVRVQNGKFESARIGSKRYNLNRITRPSKGCGPLSVFDNFNCGVAFLNAGEALFVCKYIPSTETKIWQINRWGDRRETLLDAMPKGKVLASEVKLTRCIFMPGT